MKPQKPAKNLIGSNNTLIEKYLRKHSFKDMLLDLGFSRMATNFYIFETCPFCNGYHISNSSIIISNEQLRDRLIEHKTSLCDYIHLYSSYRCCSDCLAMLDIQHHFIDDDYNDIVFTDPYTQMIHLKQMYHLIESLKRPYPREVFTNRIRGANQELFFDFNPGKPQKTMSANILYRAIYKKYAHEPPTLSLIPKNAL